MQRSRRLVEAQYANSMFMGPYLMAAFLPDRSFRPIVSGGVLYWRGQDVTTKEQFSETALGTFSPPELWVSSPGRWRTPYVGDCRFLRARASDGRSCGRGHDDSAHG